jgi:hypothetical protein
LKTLREDNYIDNLEKVKNAKHLQPPSPLIANDDNLIENERHTNSTRGKKVSPRLSHRRKKRQGGTGSTDPQIVEEQTTERNNKAKVGSFFKKIQTKKGRSPRTTAKTPQMQGFDGLGTRNTDSQLKKVSHTKPTNYEYGIEYAAEVQWKPPIMNTNYQQDDYCDIHSASPQPPT